MEEAVDAAAVAIGFLGENALQSSAGRLVRLAERVRTDGVHDEVREELIAAAAALYEVRSDAARRSAAVVRLQQAASTLETALGVHAEALGVAAADLARACGDYRAAADALEKVRRAPAPQVAGPPWWSLRRWSRRAPARAEDTERLLLDHSPDVVIRELVAKFLISVAVT